MSAIDLKSVVTAGWHRALRPLLTLLRRVAGAVIDRFPASASRLGQWTWLWQPGWGRRHHEHFYENTVDPYGFDTPQEQTKYRETLALLSDRRYPRALEVGAGEGLFTAMLQPLCDSLVATEVSEVALTRARENFSALPGVSFERRTLPFDLPDGTFDLIVISDVAYFWTQEVIDRGLTLIAQRLRPGGRMLLLHYRGEFGASVSGDYVHDRVAAVAEDLDLPVRENLQFSYRGPHDSGYRVDLVERPREDD